MFILMFHTFTNFQSLFFVSGFKMYIYIAFALYTCCIASAEYVGKCNCMKSYLPTLLMNKNVYQMVTLDVK